LVAEQPSRARVLGEEQRRVDQDADLLAGAAEQLVPCLAGNAAAIGVDADQFRLACLGPAALAAAGGIRPQVVVVLAKAAGSVPPVGPVGDAAEGQPPFDGLDVDAAAEGKILGGGPGAEHRGTEPLVRVSGHLLRVQDAAGRFKDTRGRSVRKDVPRGVPTGGGTFDQWTIAQASSRFWAFRTGIFTAEGPRVLIKACVMAGTAERLADQLCLQAWLESLAAGELEAVWRDGTTAVEP
jgi:hypothetical protein